MKRRTFLAGGIAAGAVPPAGRPNLVLLIVDGFRAEMLAAAGNQLLRTPRLDSLAARGVRFTNHYCANGVCMPCRASILTGRYPNTHGVLSNGIPLSRSEVTLGHALRDHGYRTAAAGKLHLEPQAVSGYPPRIRPGSNYYGFDQVELCENLGCDAYTNFLRRNFAGASDRDLPDSVNPFVPTGKEPLPEDASMIHWITGHTVDFIRRSAGAPFFAYCSFKDLTPPDSPPRGFAGMYKPADMPMPARKPGELEKKPPHYKIAYEYQLKIKRYPDDALYRVMMADYYAQMSFIDKQAGRILDALRDVGALDNTTVVVTGDHGLCLGDHWIWRHGPWLYDQVMRVPLLMAGPGIPRGKVVTELVESVDILPTILECHGLPVPPGVQGVSLRPLWNGTGAGKDTVWAHEREPHELTRSGVDPKGFHAIALRSKEWKYVHYAGRDYGELYDLRNDPGEFENLWTDRRAVREEYRGRLLERLMAAVDQLPARMGPF